MMASKEFQLEKKEEIQTKKWKKSKFLGVVSSTVAVAVSGNELNEPELNSSNE